MLFKDNNYGVIKMPKFMTHQLVIGMF